MKKHNAFTMLELVFVIVIMGIIGKFGLEFIAQAYTNFLSSSVNNTLQSNSATTIEFIATRLQNRIKSSVRISNAGGETNSIALGDNAFLNNATVLEWIGSDIDGFRGNSLDTVAQNFPNWSGIIDVLNPTAPLALDVLTSPGTDTGEVNSLIDTLSQGDTGINDSAIYFIGSNDGDITQFGWNTGIAMADQTSVMHPITTIGTNLVTQFAPRVGTWSGVDVYEYYKLAWTAYAIAFENIDANGFGELALYYDYQPWQGDRFTDVTTKRALLMQNVTSFRFLAVNTMIKIQVCVGSDLVEDYSICKEKTVY